MDTITLTFYERNRQRLPENTGQWAYRAIRAYSEQCSTRYNRLFCQDRPRRGKSRVMQLSRMYPAKVTLYQADADERRAESEYSHSEGAHR